MSVATRYAGVDAPPQRCHNRSLARISGDQIRLVLVSNRAVKVAASPSNLQAFSAHRLAGRYSSLRSVSVLRSRTCRYRRPDGTRIACTGKRFGGTGSSPSSSSGRMDQTARAARKRSAARVEPNDDMVLPAECRVGRMRIAALSPASWEDPKRRPGWPHRVSFGGRRLLTYLELGDVFAKKAAEDRRIWQRAM